MRVSLRLERDGERVILDGELNVDVRDFGLKPMKLLVLSVAPLVTRTPSLRRDEIRLTVCLAIPGQIIEIVAEQPLLARVNVGSVQRNVNIGLLENGEVAPGDWILIHVGFALSKIDEGQAQDQLRMLRAMGEDQLAIEEVRGYSFAEPKGEEDEIRR